MRTRIGYCLALCLVALGSLAATVAFSEPNVGSGGDGPRPPQITPYPATPEPPQPTPVQPRSKSPIAPGFPPVSFFGTNLYLTGLERSDNQASTLGAMAAQDGVKWSREELAWANIEINGKGQFNWSTFDRRLGYDAANGIQVVGMLLTTARWASTNPSAPDWWWYEPANFNDYFDFVRAAVNRWKGQIHVWEIWNEPNAVGTWKCVNSCDRAADYARLLQGAYSAVKSVDPTARVLIGGIYVHDYNDEGMAFLNQVVAASGGALNFDALSIHTYMPDRVPESLESLNVLQNFQYRLYMVNDWINAHGSRPTEVWITEDGRSTCTSCPYPWTEDQQANMLVRMYGIAAAAPRVVQFDYFQFEDKFNNPADLWGAMSIVRDNLTTKPAYQSYKIAAQMLDGATYAGQGPQMVPGNNPHQPDTSDWVGFDYRFTKNGGAFHLVWRVNDGVTIDYPVETALADVVDRDGGVTRVAATNGTIRLTISPRPQYIVNAGCDARFSDVCPGDWVYPYVECLASRGIISGYSDGTFRPNNNITRGQLSKVVSNAAGFNDTISGQTFEDVPPSNSFYVYIERMARHGAISGYACGGAGEPCGPGNRPYFRPNNNATRGQIAKIVSNAAGFNDAPSGQTFQDVPPAHTFYTWVQRLASRGIMGGYNCGGAGEPCGPGNRPYFRPGNNATRGQTSKIVANTFFPGCAVR